MFGISMWELGIIIVIALIALGPRQLAEAAKVAGRLYREITKLTDDLRNSIDLDSLNSDPGPREQRTHDPEPSAPPPGKDSVHAGVQEMHQLTDPDGRTGADFYAKLLEESEEDEPSEAESPEHEAEATANEHQGDEKENSEEKKKQREAG